MTCHLCSYKSKGPIGMRLHYRYSHHLKALEYRDFCNVCKKLIDKDQFKSHIIFHRKRE